MGVKNIVDDFHYFNSKVYVRQSADTEYPNKCIGEPFFESIDDVASDFNDNGWIYLGSIYKKKIIDIKSKLKCNYAGTAYLETENETYIIPTHMQYKYPKSKRLRINKKFAVDASNYVGLRLTINGRLTEVEEYATYSNIKEEVANAIIQSLMLADKTFSRNCKLRLSNRYRISIEETK